MDEFDNTIALTDDEGEEHVFEFLDCFGYNDNEYVVLMPVDKYGPVFEDESASIVILKTVSSDSEDTETYTSIEDEKEAELLYQIFKAQRAKRMKQKTMYRLVK